MLKFDSPREEVLKKIADSSEDVKAVWFSNVGEDKKQVHLSVLVDDTKHVDTISTVEDAISGIRDKLPEHIEVRPLCLLTTFLELVKHGDPKTFASLREPAIVYDPSNYIRLLTQMIKKGLVYELDERAIKLLEKAFTHVEAVRVTLKESVALEIHEAVIESAQAVLMYAGKNPTNAEQFADALQKLLGERMKKEVALYRDLYAIDSGELIKDIDKHLAKAKQFVAAMEDQLMEFEAAKDEKSLSEMCNYCATLYDKLMKRLAIKEKDLDTFSMHFRDEISAVHLETLKQVLAYRLGTKKEKQELAQQKHLDRIHLNALKIVLEQQL